MSDSGVEIIPSAKRLIRSLRDMGYEFEAAVADLIDNSIAARANTVRVDVVWNGDYSYVMISDNGEGMTGPELREALRFGSEREYDTEDLGKFGLGLKTASMSQCVRLTVASRQNPSRADVSAFCWDLDHVEKSNRWEILSVRSASLPPEARQHLKETPGTVVIWERLDRILEFKKPDGEYARKHLMAMCRTLEDHLAMVFHRFLAGEVRGKRLAIYINSQKVMPWDPFARSEQNTKKLSPVQLRVEGQFSKSDVIIEPFVLPPQSRFSSPEAFNRASGPLKWNRQQGFYIYRADRMIQSGGWSNLRTIDEHTKLARIALSFSPKLDADFKINVPKMKVSLPASIRDEVGKAIAPVVRIANEDYRKGQKGPEAPARRESSTPQERSPVPPVEITPRDDAFEPMQPSGSVTLEVQRSLLPSQIASSGAAARAPVANLEMVASALEDVCTPEELPVVRRVVARAKAVFGGN